MRKMMMIPPVPPLERAKVDVLAALSVCMSKMNKTYHQPWDITPACDRNNGEGCDGYELEVSLMNR
jgi:hypothetical protein